MTNQERLQEAKDMRSLWIEAEKAVTTGKEYRIGTRSLKRADIKEIRDSIKYWTDEIAKLEGAHRIRVRQVIPRNT